MWDRCDAAAGRHGAVGKEPGEPTGSHGSGRHRGDEGRIGQRFFDLARAAVPEIDAEAADQLVRALADFTDAELDPDPISLNGTTWTAAKRTAEHLSREVASLLRRGRIH